MECSFCLSAASGEIVVFIPVQWLMVSFMLKSEPTKWLTLNSNNGKRTSSEWNINQMGLIFDLIAVAVWLYDKFQVFSVNIEKSCSSVR